MSHREKAPWKTQDTLERLCLSAGLGTPLGSPRKSWRKCLGAVDDDDKDEDSALPESSANFQDNPSLAPYLFVGKCGKALGNFIVLVKSDEEIKGDNLCAKVKCQHDGKCVVVSGTFIAMCECKYPYYGDHCEMSLESYERQLQQDTEDRTRTQAQSSGRSADRGSQKSTTRHSPKHRPKKSNKRRPQKRKPKKITKQRSQKQNPQKSTKRRSRKPNPQKSTKRRSRKPKPQKSTKRRSRKPKPQQVAQGSSTNRGSSTSVQLSSVKGQDVRSFCGSLCDDKTTKPPIL
ncbi:hypothetical protein L3Q82_004585 [Scortum barcoo]|uniref:Uncharacterized protein n=1 Tax=Scortum barcoo TaxID=214431 RepID=A0ACB8VH64_9TELE|nr:hypothetical protein L3Q82_004585 [Scortum barcoo]